MNLAFYQILTPLLAIIMIARIVSKFRRDERSFREVVLQVTFWIGLLLVAVYPDFFINYIQKWTGIKSGINGILFFSILVLGLLVIHLLHENEKRSIEITKLVRHLALQKNKK
jgi:hypothetical protein